MRGKGELAGNNEAHKSKSLVGKFLKFNLFNFWPHPAACWILVPQPGVKPTPPALTSRVLTTRPLGRSLVGKSHKEEKERLKICTGKKKKNKHLILMKTILVKWKQFNCGFSKIDQRIKLINGVAAFLNYRCTYLELGLVSCNHEFEIPQMFIHLLATHHPKLPRTAIRQYHKLAGLT